MNTAIGPTHEEVLREVGKPAPRGLARLVRPGLFALGLGALAGLAAWRIHGGPRTETHYLTAAVERGALASTITATGTLQGKDTVSVGAETSGRVKAVFVDFNDAVKAGQVLAEIDPANIKAALAQATAQLAAARANVKNAEATAGEAELAARRTRTMRADGLSSASALETAEAAALRAVASVESARAQVIVAEAQVAANRTSLDKTQVRSPMDGVVLSRSVEVGQALAATMSTPELFTIARDLRQMEVTISIDEADVGQVQAGQKVTFTVDAWPGRTFQGLLRTIHNVAVTNDNVVQYEALLDVPNDALLLRPGMTATVTVHTAERANVLIVPNAALRFTPPATGKARGRSPFEPPGPPAEVKTKGPSDDRPRVWTLENGTPHEVIVQIGLSDGSRSEVTGRELAAGAQVITDVTQGVSP